MADTVETEGKQDERAKSARVVELVETLLPYYRASRIAVDRNFEETWRELYDLLKVRLLGFFWNRGVRHTGKAEDAVQRTLITVDKQLHTLKEPKAFMAWLFMVARTAMGQEVLRPDPADPHWNAPFPSSDDEAKQLGLLPDAPNQIEEVWLAADKQWEIEEILNRLCDRCREVITMRCFEGLSPGEIAQVIGGCTESNVSVWLTRCVAKAVKVAKQLAAEGTLGRP